MKSIDDFVFKDLILRAHQSKYDFIDDLRIRIASHYVNKMLDSNPLKQTYQVYIKGYYDAKNNYKKWGVTND